MKRSVYEVIISSQVTEHSSYCLFQPMRHRKKVVDKSIPSRPLVCAILGTSKMKVNWSCSEFFFHCSISVQRCEIWHQISSCLLLWLHYCVYSSKTKNYLFAQCWYFVPVLGLKATCELVLMLLFFSHLMVCLHPLCLNWSLFIFNAFNSSCRSYFF